MTPPNIFGVQDLAACTFCQAHRRASFPSVLMLFHTSWPMKPVLFNTSPKCAGIISVCAPKLAGSCGVTSVNGHTSPRRPQVRPTANFDVSLIRGARKRIEQPTRILVWHETVPLSANDGDGCSHAGRVIGQHALPRRKIRRRFVSRRSPSRDRCKQHPAIHNSGVRAGQEPDRH